MKLLFNQKARLVTGHYLVIVVIQKFHHLIVIA